MTAHPLEELREQLVALKVHPDEIWGGPDWNGAIDEAEAILDTFIEAHPGMTDSTMPCRKCRRPIADGQYLGGFPYSEYAPYCDKCWDGGERERFMKLHQLMSGTSRRPAP
jgi:hypothetical protein